MELKIAAVAASYVSVAGRRAGLIALAAAMLGGAAAPLPAQEAAVSGLRCISLRCEAGIDSAQRPVINFEGLRPASPNGRLVIVVLDRSKRPVSQSRINARPDGFFSAVVGLTGLASGAYRFCVLNSAGEVLGGGAFTAASNARGAAR